MDFPEPIKRALEALGDKNRRKMLLLLENTPSLSYSEINAHFKDELSSKGTINYHIDKLESAGLISNYLETTPGERPHSYYEVTPLCQSLINAIYEVYEGKVKVTAHPVSCALNYQSNILVSVSGATGITCGNAPSGSLTCLIEKQVNQV